ncbi:MAG: hypothetical protein EHM28_06905, partial [Spirochaetaceae bacterium]
MKMRQVLISLTISFSAALTVLGAQAYGQEIPHSPAKVDPVSLFDAKIGDQDLELLLAGSWRATTGFGTGIQFGPGDTVLFPGAFPSFAPGFFFEQVPDLTFSVWFAKRYFLEVTVLSQAEDNTILLGYQGLPGEFVQRVLIGNKDTRIGAYDFIDVPSQSTSSIAASGLFSSGFSTHELLIRYDSTREERKVFAGTDEVAELRQSPVKYLRGRYFMLPDQNVENLSVYLEDKNGQYTDASGRHFRKANLQEIAQDTANGFLHILIEHKGRIALHYTVGANTVGDAALGTNALPGVAGGYIDADAAGTDFDFGQTWLGDSMAARQLTIDSRTCLLLYEPGAFSPFEMLSVYDLGTTAPEDISRVRMKTIPVGAPQSSYTLPDPVYFRVDPGRRFFIAYADAAALRSNFRNHYPFPDTLHQLYGPQRDHIPSYFEYEVLSQAPAGATSFVLAVNTIPGSVRVKRNGVEETRFTVDYASGVIQFLAPIFPYDRIEVIYRTNGAEKNSGDLLFAWGNRFPWNSMAQADLGLGVRWNVLPGAFTEEAYDKTGAVVLSASLYGGNDIFSYRLAGAVSYSNPDTTGIMRLAGMEGQGLVLEPDEDLAYPSAVPSAIAGLTPLNRGRILYRDYREYDSFGGFTLMPYDWTPPSGQIWAYVTGSKPGPYTVSGASSGSRGESLVMDFQFDAAGEWAGFQFPFSYKNGTTDLSNIRSVITSLRAVGLTDTVDVYIQIGALDEDVDGDGSLDTEHSQLSQGFLFDDSAMGASLYVGGGPRNEGNNLLNTEDIDGNGFLDEEDDAFVYTGTAIPFAAGDTAWGNRTDVLSLGEQEALKRVRAIRIVVVNTGAGASNGRLLLDKLTLAGTTVYGGVTSGTGTLDIREIRESMTILTPPPESLEAAFSEVEDVFHSSGDNQEVLELTWSGGLMNWEVKKILGDGVQGINYRRLVFYAYLPAATGQPFVVELQDLNGNGITATINDGSIPVGAWQRLEIDLEDRLVWINNASVPATVTRDSKYGSLIVFSASMANTAAGALLLDEIHLTEPEGRLGAAMLGTAMLDFKGPLVLIGEVPAIKDFSLKEEVTVRSEGFSTLYSRPQDETGMRSDSSAGVGLFFMRLTGQLSAISSGSQWTFDGGHKLLIPDVAFPVVFTDQFSLQSRATGMQWSRSNTIIFTLDKLVQLDLASASNLSSLLLTQSWKGGLSISALAPYNLVLQTAIDSSQDDYAFDDTWYLDAWVSGFSFLLPVSGGSPVQRSWNTSLQQKLGTTPVGVSLSLYSGFKSYNIQAASRTQADNISSVLSVPVKLGPVTIEASYKRNLVVEDFVAEHGDLVQDASLHWSRWGQHVYFYASVPIYEIFSDEMEKTFRDQAGPFHRTSYLPEISLSMMRTFGSTPWDLLAPSKLTMSYGRENVMEDLLYNAFEKVSASVLWNALNVFGNSSTSRLIPWYDIDSFATSVNMVWKLREDRVLDAFLFSLEGLYTFENRSGLLFSARNFFSLENSESMELQNRTTLDFTWKVVPENGIALP